MKSRECKWEFVTYKRAFRGLEAIWKENSLQFGRGMLSYKIIVCETNFKWPLFKPGDTQYVWTK